VAAGGGTLGGTTTIITDESGKAEFTDLKIEGDGPHVLIFAATGYTAVSSDPIDVRRAGGDSRSSSQTRIVADSPDPSSPGQAVRVEFTVSGNGGTPTGTVTVIAAGRAESCSASVSAGFCDLTLMAADNSLEITATYSGDARFRGSSDTEKHRVEAPRTNEAPTAVDDEYQILEGFEHTLSVSATDGVLRNDQDPDGDPLTASDASDPSIGTVRLNADGSFTYGPDPDAYGTDRFTYRVRDPAGHSSTATVTVHVIPVNDSPRFSLTRDHLESDASPQTMRGFATGISAGANGNEEHQELEFVLSTDDDALFTMGPAISDDGTLTYTPSGRTGTASVTVVLRDDAGTANNGNDTSEPQRFRITVR
jgi:hypothetical protein